MNNIQLTGYFNNIKQISKKTKKARFSYMVKTKTKELEKIYIDVYFSKDLYIDLDKRYIIDGFLVGDIIVDDNKEITIPKIRITKITPLIKKEDYKNNINIYASVSNLKQINDKISLFRLSYSIKLKDNSKKYIYVDALISNDFLIKNFKSYNFKGFFTANIYLNKYTNEKIKKIEFFITDI